MAYLGNHPIDSVGIDSGSIVDGTIQTIDIANGAVTSSKISGITTSSISEGTNLYYTDTRTRAAISVAGSGSYNSSTGVITITGGVTSVNTLTGAVTLSTTNISEGTNLYYTDTRTRAAISAGTGVNYNSSTGIISIDQAVGTNSNVQFNSIAIGLTPVTNNGILQLGGYAAIKALIETATISATAATGTINYDAATQAVLYYTSNATANWTLNLRGSSTLSLNSMLAIGQSLTVAFLVQQGGTAYYSTALQVDGTSVTPKWQGGTAPTSGNTNSIDIYTYTVIKTANATYTVLASVVKFA